MGSGATFKKFDLHLHAPGTGQKFTIGEQLDLSSPKQRLEFARRYVRQAREKAGLDLIAITNHNDTSWVEPLRQAARQVGDGLVVLPGVEVATFSSPCLHVVVLFDADTPADWIERFLDDVGLPDVDSRFAGNAVQPTQKSFPQLLECIERRHGLAIAAHVCEKNGLLHSSVRGKIKPMMFTDRRLLAVEIPGDLDNLDDWTRHVVTNTHQEGDWRRSRLIACVNSSDAKSLDDIGRRFTYVKCEESSLAALRQAMLDPEARLRLKDNPPIEPSLCLERLSVADTPTGFLRGLELSFNPLMNCIIGGRGSGKSAVIELLRYLWELEPLRPVEMQGFVEVFFPETAQAELLISKEGASYRLRRMGRRTTQVERQEPDGTWTTVSLQPGALFHLQVYGQKEILYTSEDVRSQLELLDRLIGGEIEDLKRKRDGLLISLRRNRETMVATSDRIRQLEDRLRTKAAIEEQLHQYHQSGLQDLAGKKRLYDRESQAWEIALGQVDQALQFLEETHRRTRPDQSFLSDEAVANLPSREQLMALRERLRQLEAALEETWDLARKRLSQARVEIQSDRQRWEQGRKQFDVQYSQALARLPGLTPDVVTRLERERLELDRVERETDQLKEEIKRLTTERRRLLHSLVENGNRQYQIRKEKAQDISGRLGRVRVSVVQGSDDEWLKELWGRYLRGSRLREDDYDRIVQSSMPTLLPLLAAVEQADSDLPDAKLYGEWLPQPRVGSLLPDPFQGIRELCNLDHEKAGKLVERLPLPVRLELDEVLPPDRVKIELNTEFGKDQKPDWRTLGRRLGEGVSVGQGCTAILSIILLQSEEVLIVDQPEDDLDNRFIYEEVVTLLRRERGRRQMIFATHNPNIPVAGDAEMIAALEARHDTPGQASSLRARIVASGFVDNEAVSEQVKAILEGGERAFELRRLKYGF